MASDEIPLSVWPKVESGFSFVLPADGAALDGDLWLEPLAKDGVKSVDFVQRRHGRSMFIEVWFIEAKTSMPQPDGQSMTPGALRKRCDEVVDKLGRTAEVILSLLAGRSPHPDITLPVWWQPTDSAATWKLVLVVTGADVRWLDGMRNVLRESLRPLARAMAMDVEPMVINAAMAQKLGLGHSVG